MGVTYGFAGPHDWIVVVAILAAIVGATAWGLWRVIRAIGRRYSLSLRVQLAILGALAVAACSTGIALSIDRLDALERNCQTELLKQARLSGSFNFEITKHVNFWNQHVSGYWGISKPYEEPKVMLWIAYVKDARKHQSLVICHYAKVPGTDEPPQVRFDRIEPWWPNVLDEQNRWVPLERPRRT